MQSLVIRFPAPPETARLDPAAARLRALLSAPMLPTMLRLALPTVVVLFVQTLVSVAETYFMSFLGTVGAGAPLPRHSRDHRQTMDRANVNPVAICFQIMHAGFS